MDKKLFQERVKSLSSFSYARAEAADAFGEALMNLDDWGLYRINPIRFAKDHDLDPNEAADLFICASRIGLFDLTWNLICPACGGILSATPSISQLNRELFHCALCNIDVPIILDDYVEITFTVSPNVHETDINLYENLDSFQRASFSENLKPSKRMRDALSGCHVAFSFVNPGEYQTFEFQAKPDTLYRLASVHVNSAVSLCIDSSEKNSENPAIHVHASQEGFSPQEVQLHPGQVTLYVHNTCPSPIGVMIFLADYPVLYKIEKESPPTWAPFLTGKMLLNNQAFRSLFKMQDLATNLKLSVRSLTMLFTDLRGSTEIYDTVGDMRAYQLIQDHFTILETSVRKHAGAIVKTMGDAIMASFSEPRNGIMAAIDMMDGIRNMTGDGKDELGLKIGLHEGPALTVNNDGRLDYFGQTVNIAARVQGLAQAEEIWVSESVFNADGVKTHLLDNSYGHEAHSVVLKGVGQRANVYKCRSLTKTEPEQPEL
ncbi:MAG TPA: adenylate/guanylate cyclase domain-containing protein [Desulfobacterales bacterium]|nr:adenylate/guanylate cyclase domain-containing protein [Desulfobacterales bacterium]